MQALDTARARVYTALERLDDALARETPGGRALPVLGADQPLRRWPWLPRAAAGAAVLAALGSGAWHEAALLAGLLMPVLLALHFVVGMARRPPHLDADVSALGWPTFAWGLGAFVLWAGYLELGETPPSPQLLWMLVAAALVAMAGLSVGHWVRALLPTGGAAPRPIPVILAPDGSVAVPPGPALYSVRWFGRLHPSLGVPCPQGIALLPLDAALENPDAITRFARRVRWHATAFATAEERRAEIHERVAAVEGALRELDADR